MIKRDSRWLEIAEHLFDVNFLFKNISLLKYQNALMLCFKHKVLSEVRMSYHQ